MISKQMMTLAARDVAGIPDIDPDFHLSINLSSDDLKSGE